MGRTVFVVWIVLIGCLAVGGTALALKETGSGKGERMVGTNGDDVLKGAGGVDTLVGKGGRDVLVGGGGEDSLHGDGGRDSFNMKNGKPLRANGRDRIYARDGHPDEINCGAGRDLAVVDDVEDGVFDCEVVVQP